MAAMLLCAGLSSCSQDDSAQSGLFPPDKYPMELTAKGLQDIAHPKQSSTRGTAENDWTKVSTLAMQVGSEVRPYTAISADGGATAILSSDTPFYWEGTSDKKTITAWHPYTASYPAEWTVKADQSTAANHQASDLIKGELKDLTFADRNNPAKNRMTFRHQTTKVVISLVGGDGITVDDTYSVQLLNVSGVEDGSTVTPYKPDSTKNTYHALLNGQTIGAKVPFIQVNAGDSKFIYTPSEAKTLEAGISYTYTITVSGTEIRVRSVSSPFRGWDNSGDSVSVASNCYMPGDLKFGDYFYQDGTTSDGGLRRLYPDGTIEIEDPKPAPVSGKTVVGIVFQTDPERVGAAEKEALATKGVTRPHGLVMAVKNAAHNLSWSSNSLYEVTSATVCPTIADCYNDISGLKNTRAVYALGNYTSDKGNYPAFKAIEDFNADNAAPENATEWFMPSEGQLWDLLENLGNVKILRLKQQRENTGNQWNGTDSDNDICSGLNIWLYNVIESDRFHKEQNRLWSSSEVSSHQARYWDIKSDGGVVCYWSPKDDTQCDTRPVLAF